MSLADGVAWEKEHPTDLVVIVAQDMARKQYEVNEGVITKAYTLFSGAEILLYDFPHVLNAFGILISRDGTSIMAKFDSDTGDFLGFMEEVEI